MTFRPADPRHRCEKGTKTARRVDTPKVRNGGGREHGWLLNTAGKALSIAIGEERAHAAVDLTASLLNWACARKRRKTTVILGVPLLLLGCDYAVARLRGSTMILPHVARRILTSPTASRLTSEVAPPLGPLRYSLAGVGDEPSTSDFKVRSGKDVLSFSLEHIGNGTHVMRVPGYVFGFADARDRPGTALQNVRVEYRGKVLSDDDVELVPRPGFRHVRRKGCRKLWLDKRAAIKPGIQIILDKIDGWTRFTDGVLVVESEGEVLQLPDIYMNSPGALLLSLDGTPLEPTAISNAGLTMDFFRNGRGTAVAGVHELVLYHGTRTISSVCIIDAFAPLATSERIQPAKEATWVYEPERNRELLRANRDLPEGSRTRPRYTKTRLGTRRVELTTGSYIVEFRAVGAAGWSLSIPFTSCFESVLPYGPGERRGAFKFYGLFHPDYAGEPGSLTEELALDIRGGTPNFEVRFPAWQRAGVNLNDEVPDTFTLTVDIAKANEDRYCVKFRQFINGHLVCGARIFPRELPASFDPEIRNRLSPELALFDYRVYYAPPRDASLSRDVHAVDSADSHRRCDGTKSGQGEPNGNRHGQDQRQADSGRP